MVAESDTTSSQVILSPIMCCAVSHSNSREQQAKEIGLTV